MVSRPFTSHLMPGGTIRAHGDGAGQAHPSSAPFIVTAELPGDVFGWADTLRRAHFPPERNWLKAHVTLFHAFAPSLREELRRVLARIASNHPRPRAAIDGLMNLGRGTALAVTSPAMLAIREEIADHFHGALTAQDHHAPRLHITIQNKVTTPEAKALQAALAPTLVRREFAFVGLGLHVYRNPQWEAAGLWPFRG